MNPLQSFIARPALLGTLAATPAASVASDTFQLSSAAGWGGAIGAGIGFLIGSVPKDDGWGWSGAGALTGAVTGGLIGSGIGQMLSGSLISGGIMTGLGAVVGVARYVATKDPSPSMPVGKPLHDGINTFDGADEKTKFKAATWAYKHAALGSNGDYETRSPIEWKFGDKGPDDNFKQTLAEGIQDAQFDTFNSLVVLTRNLPAAKGDPAVVVVEGASKLQQVQVGTNGLKLPDGTDVPFSSIRAAVGFAER